MELILIISTLFVILLHKEIKHLMDKFIENFYRTEAEIKRAREDPKTPLFISTQLMIRTMEENIRRTNKGMLQRYDYLVGSYEKLEELLDKDRKRKTTSPEIKIGEFCPVNIFTEEEHKKLNDPRQRSKTIWGGYQIPFIQTGPGHNLVFTSLNSKKEVIRAKNLKTLIHKIIKGGGGEVYKIPETTEQTKV